MTWETLFNTIRTRYDEEIVDLQDVTAQYDNAPFTKPQNAIWTRLAIRPADSMQVSVGGTQRYRTRGLMIASIFAPIETGENDALELADAIKTAFQSVTISGVVFQTPSITTIGRIDGEWMLNVQCPWYADDVV